MSKVVNILQDIYILIWTYRGTIDDLYLQIQIERMINATLVTPIYFTGELLDIFVTTVFPCEIVKSLRSRKSKS